MREPPRKPTVAEYLTAKIDASGKTQREIATEISYENPNIITMFKTGSTKLPLTTVGPMARALRVDPVYLLRLVMSEYMPETFDAVEHCLGTTILTDNERALIEEFRRYTAETNPEGRIFKGEHIVAFGLRRDE